jgi:hypothetical protein
LAEALFVSSILASSVCELYFVTLFGSFVKLYFGEALFCEALFWNGCLFCGAVFTGRTLHILAPVNGSPSAPVSGVSC